MGKIKTKGSASLAFEPDLFAIGITVQTEEKTSGAAISAGKKQTEYLLQILSKNLNIEPEQISAENEEVSIPYQKECYSYSRRLLLKIPANNDLRELITDLLADMDNVTYSVGALLTGENEKKQIVMDAAIQNAKLKAEKMAASLESKIIGFEQIYTDGDIDDFECPPNVKQSRSCSSLKSKSLASQLKNPKIELEGEVTVIWLTEPLA